MASLPLPYASRLTFIVLKIEGNIYMAVFAFAKTPEPPYYAAIFSTQKSAGDNGYYLMAERMAELASKQPGFLGMESVRDGEGFGITVSYWASLEAIAAWKMHAEHQVAQQAGKRVWYEHYEIRIAKVERAYSK